MRMTIAGFGLLLVLDAIAITANAEVSVTFIEPQRYTDAGLRGNRRIGPEDPLLIDLQQFLAKLGERYLEAQDRLHIEVLDIDLAGRYDLWREAGRAVRILQDDTVPRITLRYALMRRGQTVLAQQETISDLAYLTRAGGRTGDDPLYFEKAMLDEWFRARFVEGRR